MNIPANIPPKHSRQHRAPRPLSPPLRRAPVSPAMTETSPFRKLPPLTATGITYRMYESPTTGLRGMLMETAEPLCSLHVAIATESDTHDWTHKDDGLPHTLEHAIFMGSELYPFKGILDKLANRSLARGTNAWTATDHTCYTMTSAGHEGCLNLLPIYADHILYPTLSDECFHTEVHHVSGEGEDKGVVYCEMQARSTLPLSEIQPHPPTPACSPAAGTGEHIGLACRPRGARAALPSRRLLGGDRRQDGQPAQPHQRAGGALPPRGLQARQHAVHPLRHRQGGRLPRSPRAGTRARARVCVCVW